MILGLAMLASAATITDITPNVDLAHNKQFPLFMAPQIFGDIRDEENGCTRNGRYCVRLTRENEAKSYQIIVFEVVQNRARIIFEEKIESEIPNPRMAIWPNLILLDWREEGQTTPNFIVGVKETEAQMYAGRGQNLFNLRLFAIQTTQIKVPMVELLNMAFESQRNVRGCYPEDATSSKDEFCPDEYHFNSSLSIDPTFGAKFPRFIYERQSAILPWSSRAEFETKARILNSPSLAKFRDNGCSFSRTLNYSAQTSQYEFSIEPPDCSDYFED